MYALFNLDNNQNRWELFLVSIIIIASIAFSFNNFLLFHSLIELFSILVGVIIFTVVYQSQFRGLSNYILIIGIGFLFISFFDFFHTVAYDGMNLIDTEGANLATQLWIIARYFHSLTFLLAFYSFRYHLKLNFIQVFLGYSLATIIIIVLLVMNIFPDCYINGIGLTTFKMLSEYIISLIFILSLYFVYLSRYELNRSVYKGFILSIIFVIMSELAFTLYIDVYGIFNIIGHVLKFISYYIVNRLVLNIAIKNPHEVLFGKFKVTQRRLNILLNRSKMSLCNWDINKKIIEFDKNGSVNFANRTQMKYTEEEFFSLIHSDDLVKLKNKINILDQVEDSSFNSTFRIELKDGNYLWYKLEGFALSDGVINVIDRIVCILKDITIEKELMNQLTIEKAKFQQLFDNANLGIALLNTDNTIMSINKQFQKMFGYSIQEVKGEVIDNIITPSLSKKEGLENYKVVLNGESLEMETVRKTKTNQNINVLIHAFPIHLEKNTIGIYAIYSDITKRKENEKYIEYLSFHDELTGLFNRRYFENAIRRLNNSRQLPISIIMGDLNDLKVINDSYGHSKGDKYLKIIANVLKESIRGEDILARVGGDEFAIILPKADEIIANRIIERITNGCNEINNHSNLPEDLSISLGYAIKNSKKDDLVEVFNQADRIMYEIKNNQKSN